MRKNDHSPEPTEEEVKAMVNVEKERAYKLLQSAKANLFFAEEQVERCHKYYNEAEEKLQRICGGFDEMSLYIEEQGRLERERRRGNETNRPHNS
jgi:phosphoglycolate phosphatase-like HAD superfamily hydrolase